MADLDQPSREAIPDLTQMTSRIIDMLMEIDTCEFKNDITRLRMYLLEKYDDVPGSIIRILASDDDASTKKENLDRLLKLFEDLQRVKDGKTTIEEHQNQFKETIFNRYIYSQFGGKEAFEQHIRNRNV